MTESVNSPSPLGGQPGGSEEPWNWEESRWRAIVNKVRAGRSLKPRHWPGGARVAVALSFDSDHESGVLRDGGTSPGALSNGEYGARAGVPRVLKLLESYAVPATFFVPAVIAKLYPEEQQRLVAAGHELGIHGWIHERNSGLDYEVERELTIRAGDVLTEITGRRPVGIRTPSWDYSQHTLEIIREMGLLYDSSLMTDDEPYELMEDGAPTGVVELPVEWIRDDAPYFNMSRFGGLRPYTPPEAVHGIWKAEFDLAREEGGLFLLTLHPHISGHRSRISVVRALICYMRTFGDVWFATHEQVARYVKEQA